MLVGKKDSSWRLFADYRDLNKATIKNKFPISLVNDLLVELQYSTMFSKIDLRVGYNQVRMANCDVRQHLGHMEATTSIWSCHLELQMLLALFKALRMTFSSKF